MISICIPIYNFNVVELVKKLIHQSNQLKIVYEVLCIDDGSENIWKEQNQSLNKLENVNYYELKNNIGRSKIRNMMAKEAKHDFLLFLDCDSAIISDTFISNYIEKISIYNVIYGGRTHGKKQPENSSLFLRWLYGVEREDKTINDREKKPFLSFRSNNFLIKKEVFMSIKFNETIVGYGHEDTFFAQELKEEEIPIKHIDNNVLHIGLESNEEFLRKTKEGIKNLIHLQKNKSEFIEDITIIKTFNKVKRFKLLFLFRLIHPIIEKVLEKKLLSHKPKLFYFDIYKLSFLIHYSK